MFTISIEFGIHFDFFFNFKGYLSRWVSWSGAPGGEGQQNVGSPMEGGYPVSPQPPRSFQTRSRTSSKASNLSEKTPHVVSN